jgi:hypothetical protein
MIRVSTSTENTVRTVSIGAVVQGRQNRLSCSCW